MARTKVTPSIIDQVDDINEGNETDAHNDATEKTKEHGAEETSDNEDDTESGDDTNSEEDDVQEVLHMPIIL